MASCCKLAYDTLNATLLRYFRFTEFLGCIDDGDDKYHQVTSFFCQGLT